MKQSKLYTKNEGGNCHRGHNHGSEKKYRSRYDRHKKITKFEIDNEITRKKSHYNKNKRTNYDYGPLYNYLLKQVGKKWETVWKDIFPRVDNNPEPIVYMVININTHGIVITHDISNAEPMFNCSLYNNDVRSYSTLYVDEMIYYNLLIKISNQKIDMKDLVLDNLLMEKKFLPYNFLFGIKGVSLYC